MKVTVKQEPQSLHWSHEQKTVHSGISKQNGRKVYTIHISNDRIHDQAFVRHVVEEMLEDLEITPGMTIIVKSDNCAKQYKSAENFYDMQDLANKYEVNILRAFGIVVHGKAEVDHVGGLAKISIRRQIAAGGFLQTATEMADFLREKFGTSESPSYSISEVNENDLEDARAQRKFLKFPTVEGSSSFQVLVFKPHATSFKAAPYLCICASCLLEYGSCDLFKTYTCNAETLNEVSLRSHEDEVHIEAPIDFLLADSIVAVAAAEDSSETMWFVKITKEVEQAENGLLDDYCNAVAAGESYLEGHFLEKQHETTRGFLYKVNLKKKTFFFKESVLYPFVNFSERKTGLFLDNHDYVDILYNIQKSGASILSTLKM